ncbi:MAG: DUF4118 domain-containing protein [Nitrospirae bacterium]|nr:DUF4118 domain-containing protein [Nitrospirota bacterium]
MIKIVIRGWILSIGSVAVCTVLASLISSYVTHVDLAMIYLLGIVVTSSFSSQGPSLLATLLSVAAFDFFFVPPYFTFAVHDARYVVTFAVMFVVAVVISRLTLRVREQADAAHQALLRAETETLRSTMLSSVSHDLRTPLAAITGAATTLLQQDAILDQHNKRELTQTIAEEAEHLNQIIRNVLDMTRLESRAITIKKEWQSLEEIAGVVLNRLSEKLKDRRISVTLPEDLPLIPFDPLLIEQVLMNLFGNAVKYTPAGTPLEISAAVREGEVMIEVADRGPGLPQGSEEHIFEKFVRGSGPGSGIGLGLAICRAIVTAHGGSIWAENRDGGGAAFRFTLPPGGEQPLMEPENE